MRKATIQRKTNETDIRLELSLDGGPVAIATGLGFFDHMLHQIAKHGGFGLILEAKGDLQVDSHHLVEDVGLCLGDALREALGDRRGIARFGEAHAPLDESLARVVVDLSGRPYCVFDADLPVMVLGDGFQTEMVREFFIAFSTRGALNLHASVLYGTNVHHRIEALFKGLARALKQATRIVGDEIASTKGTLTV
jgi:imidazoleglycerol-phosphate dehydratase